MKNQIEIWKEILAKSIGKASEEEVDACMDDVGGTEWYRLAKMIVEPEGISSSYHDWQDANANSWAGFIQTVGGKSWNRLARSVNGYGY